jgi:carboxymethylenebutenolidase
MTEDERSDVLSLVPGAEPVTRRGFVAGASVLAGFALAARPLKADTVVTTDTTGLAAGMAEVPAPDGRVLPAYFARPATGTGFPTILVVQEIFGVHEHIRDVCRRVAKLGYLGVAPELFFRQGDPTTFTDVPTLVREVVSKVPDAQVLADLDATARWAAGAGGDGRRLGITGFCWGGRISWLYAAHAPTLKAGVAWYGRLVGEASANTPRHPVDVAAELKAPVLGLYGGADAGIPLDTVERMRAALKAAGSPSEIVVFPEAPHAFHADYRPSYRPEAAREGWQRMQAWFARHLAA